MTGRLRVSTGTGRRGETGATGATGATGTAATIAVGTVTTGSAGSNASVSNSGTSAAAVFNFTIPRGDTGATGSTGATGATGAQGELAAIQFTFSTTTTDSDPGNGYIRFNNAALASVTEIYIDNLDAAGNTVSGLLDTLDDVSNSAAKSVLTVFDAADPSIFLSVQVTGSVTDGTGYRKIGVAVVASGGTFVNDNTVGFVYALSGADGGGTGTVTSVAVSGSDGIEVDSGSPITSSGTIALGLNKANTLTFLNVEDGADVTDATNVEAAGAVMDGDIGVTVQAYDADLAAVAGLSSSGLVARTGAGTAAARTVTAGTGISVTDGDGVSGNPTVALGTGYDPLGKHTIFIPASAMIAATTSGPASADLESTTNDVNYTVLDFDASADEHAHFQVAFPKGWNEGTVTFRAFWTSTATDTDGVAWGLEGLALSDNEAIDASWGTAVVVTDDAQSAAGELYVTAESSAITIAGTPAEGDMCFFRVFRDVSDANDDMTEDARLVGIQLFFTINAAKDD